MCAVFSRHRSSFNHWSFAGHQNITVFGRRERERQKYFLALFGTTVFKRTQKWREVHFSIRRKLIFKAKYGTKICHWHSTPKFSRRLHFDKLPSIIQANLSLDYICLNGSQVHDLWHYFSLLSYLWNERKMHLLGVGTFGKVFFAEYSKTRFVLKFCAKRNVHQTSAERGEQNSFGLIHTNIVRTYLLLDVNTPDLNTFGCNWIYSLLVHQLLRVQTSAMQIVLMEFVGDQSLQELINDKLQQINEAVRNTFCMQVLSALSYCHRNCVIHLDLKPSNIVITADGICKLVDFGCSKKVKQSKTTPDFDASCTAIDECAFGTVAYTAPEIFRNVEPTEKCDIYSFGIIMWQLITRENPYSNLVVDCPQTIIYKVVADNLRPKFSDEAMTDYSQYCKLAECCWNASPTQRPSAATLWQEFNIYFSDAGYHSFLV